MTADEALLAIQEIMDGVEWNSDTTEKIANIMIQAGYRIRDLDDIDRDETNPFQDRSEIQRQAYNKVVDGVIEGMMQDAGLHGIGVVHISKQEMLEPADQPAATPLPVPSQDHERIWLEPDGGHHGERCWCKDTVWPEDEGDPEPTKYLRADLVIERSFYDAAVKDQIAASEQNLKLKAVLKELVSDIASMRYIPDDAHEDSGYWFGAFSEVIDGRGWRDSDTKIEWPNLAITTEKAETLLKELG